MNRFFTLAPASFGGAMVAAAGALVAAGSPLLALLPLLAGGVLLAAAKRRLEELERVVWAAYNRQPEDEVFVDPFGPFGWLRASE